MPHAEIMMAIADVIPGPRTIRVIHMGEANDPILGGFVNSRLSRAHNNNLLVASTKYLADVKFTKLFPPPLNYNALVSAQCFGIKYPYVIKRSKIGWV